jgi:prevent-host-death family protein
MDISVRELKNHLSACLRRVQGGEELVVTSRGKEVARLVPPRGEDPERAPEEAAIARFRRLPWVRPGLGKKTGLPEPLIRIGPGEKTLADIVSEQRD